MFIATLFAALLVVTTIFIHFEALRLTSLWLPYCRGSGRSRMFIVIVSLFTAHIFEIGLYALGYVSLEKIAAVGQLESLHAQSFMNYLYYSTVSYTSLGLGDVFPVGHLRLISGIEALNGLLLIGWSTSFTFLAMREYWPMAVSEAQSNDQH